MVWEGGRLTLHLGLIKKLTCLVVGEGLFGLFCVKRAVLVLAKAGESMGEVVLRC